MKHGIWLACFELLTFGNLAAAAGEGDGRAVGGVLILDDRDEVYEGKGAYEDGLVAVRGDGTKGFEITGLNNCQTVGSNHQVAVDRARGWVWVAESVANGVRRLDLAGTELMKLAEVPAKALAVDEATGNVWALLSGGTIDGGSVVVLDPQGNALARHGAAGFDIAHDARGKAFWVAGKRLTKIDAKSGEVLMELDITNWCAVSLACDPGRGLVWVVTRRHPQVAGSANELLCFDTEGVELKRVPLKEDAPFKVCVEPKSGDVWVCAVAKAMLRYSHAGELKLRHEVYVITADVEPASGEVWVVTMEEALRLNAEGEVRRRVKLGRKTQQAWCVGF